jgi:hypothetical protein
MMAAVRFDVIGIAEANWSEAGSRGLVAHSPYHAGSKKQQETNLVDSVRHSCCTALARRQKLSKV